MKYTENEIKSIKKIKRMKEFWQNKLSIASYEKVLPYDYNINAKYKKATIVSNLNNETCNKIITMSGNQDMLIYSIMLAALQIQIHKYGNENFIINIPIYEKSENNMSINSNLPLISSTRDDMTIKEVIVSCKNNILETYKNQYYSLKDIDIEGTPYDSQTSGQFSLSMTNIHSDNDISQINETLKNHINMCITRKDNNISIKAIYNSNLYRSEIIKLYLDNYINVLKNSLNSVNKSIEKIDMLNIQQKDKLLSEFNETKAEYPEDKTIKELFEKVADIYSESIAVVSNSFKITYKELNERANKVANYLRKKGVNKDNIIGILCDRSIDTVVSILGVVKSGGAYLPLDLDYPAQRVNQILEDSQSRILLGKKEQLDKLNLSNLVEKVNIEDSKILDESLENPTNINTPRDLIYLIYTSGSTGKPKGVCIEHRGVTRLIKNNSHVVFEENDRILKVLSMAFDPTVIEVWGSLINGKTLYLASKEDVLNIDRLEDIIINNKITFLQLSSPLFTSLASEKLDMFKHLNQLIIGGDVISTKAVKRVLKVNQNIKVINAYGPTENTVTSTAFVVKGEDDIQNNIPIGTPISNSTCYILNKNNELMPIGVPGELCVGGDGVARGYLNRTELTKEKFIENPYVKGERIYKTGDLARWLPDGNIDFLGRIDEQVKIRGYRIELGEIEKELLKNKAIKEAIVIDRKDENGTKYLCSYIVGEENLNVKEIKKKLRDIFPDYMIPSYIMQIDKIPLNINGKVDRTALPELELDSEEKIYVAPQNAIEEKIVNVWSEVLGVEKISIKDNYIDLGGDSLKAISIVSKLRKELGIRVDVMDIFNNKTIEEIALSLKASKKDKYSKIEKVEEKEYYEVSSAQKRMYALNQISKNVVSYNMPHTMMIKGHLDRVKIEETIKKIIKRHESFRTSFHVINGEVVQKVNASVDFKVGITKINCKLVNKVEVDKTLNALIRPFDLSKAPLIRVELIEAKDGSLLLIDIHHIISDGVSYGIFLEEFNSIYEGRKLEKTDIQYKDFANWQNEMVNNDLLKEQENYWLEQFEGEIPKLDMPTDFKRNKIQRFEGDHIDFKIDKKLRNKINILSKETGTTRYMIFLSALNILLSKYTSQEDIIVGTPSEGRTHIDIEKTIGMFVNTLAIRNYPKGEKTFIDFLNEVKETSLRAVKNQDYQFEKLLDKLNIKREESNNPLFNVMFTSQDYNPKLKIGNIDIEHYNSDYKISKFDLSMFVSDDNESTSISIEYSTNLYKGETIERLYSHYLNILNTIVENKDIKLKDIDIVYDEEKKMILEKFNDTKVEYPKSKTVVELFEEVVENYKDRIAIASRDIKITYKDLNNRANKVANYLIKKGVTREDMVGVLCDRSLDTIISILGIVKSGGAYMPIDEDYPKQRVKYMLKDSGSKILMGKKVQLVALDLKELDIEMINTEDKKLLSEDTQSPTNRNLVDDLIYLIYTSGSTGKSKGVCVQNRNVVRLVKSQNYIDLKENDKILQTGSIAFDASTFEIWGALLNGITVHIESKNLILSPGKLKEYINNNDINKMFMTTALFHQICNVDLSTFDNIDTLLIGGEVLDIKTLNKFKEYNNWTKFSNIYGPTENTTFSTSYQIKETIWNGERSIPIGKPISNSTAYIMDKNNNLLPVGIPGELCVGGDGVARGYLNRKELTQNKFVENPYIEGEKIYKTGDLVKWLPDGNIEFLGRIDNQVKIRGFRIELGEIENQITKHKYVKETVVIDRKDEKGNKYLCAYIIAEKKINTENIKQNLKSLMPNYMIPSYIMQIEKMPLNINKKIAREKLPKPNTTLEYNVYVAPTNKVEEKIVKAWEEVLGIEKISINDRFLDIGGDSLKAINIVYKLRKELGIKVDIMDIFNNNTIEDIAKSLVTIEEETYSKIKKVEEKEYYQTSSAQKRMYALNQTNVNTTSYNMPYLIGKKGIFDKENIENILNEIIERHEVFRTSFHIIDGEVVQKVYDSIDFKVGLTKLECVLNDKEEINEILSTLIRPFDLSKAPLIRAEIIEVKDNSLLLIDMHHIISDGASYKIFIDEFTSIYEGRELEKVGVQYKDFAHWQSEMLTNDLLKKQENYWLEQFKGELPRLNMPTDYKRKQTQNFEGDHIKFELDTPLRNKINTLLKETGTTRYMLFLSALNILLSKYTSQEDIIVGTPSEGRTHVDINKTIGMFVNTLAIRNYPSSEKTFIDFLNEVKETSLIAVKNQDYQFEKLLEKLNIKREEGENPLFNVMFTAQEFNLKMEMGDLNIKAYESEYKVSKFDLSMFVSGDKENTDITIEYSTTLYKKETIERLKRHYLNILNTIVKNKNIKLKDIEILSDKEKKIIVNQFNDTKVEYPRNKTVKELFEEIVEKCSNKIAIVSKDKELSYKELNKRANQIGHLLRKRGITRDSIVPIICDKSIDTIIGMLGIIKAGGAYLPIDEDYPEARLKYMIKDSDSNIVLGKKKLLSKYNLKELNVESINIELDNILEECSENLEYIPSPEDLIYVIYTSGSTGKPKGVCVEHRNVVRLVKNTNFIDFKEEDRILQTGSMAFDASTFEIWGTLLNGLTVYIESRELILKPEELKNYINKNNITTLFMTTALFHQICNVDLSTFDNLDTLLVGGEVLDIKILNKFKSYNNRTTFSNIYGPTENTTYSTSYHVKDGIWNEGRSVPIGTPISNSTAYIIDKNNKLLPIGIPGELCVGGDGVARGYLNNPYLTTEKFIENPYVKGEIIYKTGDLARMLPNGNIEFIGRIDNQVKIRGFRIELGEIEKQISKHGNVKEVVVIDKKDEKGNKYLCAFVVGEVSAKDLEKFLKKNLPDYMIPRCIMKLKEMPITSNGKVDRKNLPEPHLNENMKKYLAPRNEIQEKLSEVWCDVLGFETISIDASFYDIGGDSIVAIQVVSRLMKYGLKLQVKDLLKYKTIEEIAKQVKTIESEISQEEVNGVVKLTPIIQKFSHIDKKIFNHFNQSMMLYSEDGLDGNIVEKAVNKIIKHHDALRIVLTNKEKLSLYNRTIKDKLYDFQEFDLSKIESYEEIIEKDAQRIQESMDVEKGPLVKVGLFKTKKGDHLLFAIHHMVVDGVSWRIILEDFINGYKALQQNNKMELPKKTSSFKEWSEKQYRYANSEECIEELKYWSELTKTKLEKLPKYKTVDIVKMKDMKCTSIVLGEEYTNKLIKETNYAYNTEINDILLSILGIAFKKWAGINRVAVTLEGHGREDILSGVDITRTVGWFTSCYPVVLDMNDNDIGTIIMRNKENLIRIPNKGIGYGILKYLTKKDIIRDFDIDIDTEVSFNYLGQFDQSIKDDSIQYSNLYAGNTVNSEFETLNSIVINALVQNGKLIVNIDFNENEYKNKEIEKFITVFDKTLKEVIDYCLQKKTTQLTPTDYGVNDYTIEDIEKMEKYIEDNIGENLSIKRINKLTPIQEGMLYTYMHDEETTAYVVQLELDIKGKIDLDNLNKTYNELLNRHEILRTIIYINHVHPSQIVLDGRDAEVEFRDYSEEIDKKMKYEKYVKGIIQNGFDLTKDVLFKLGLVKINEDNYRLVLTIHHIIIDGWSNAILISELFAIYEDIANDKKISLKPIPKYQDYIEWLFKQKKKKGLKYWNEYLKGYDQVLSLSRNKVKAEGYEEGIMITSLSAENTKKLQKISKLYGLTLNTICQTAWGLLLQSYTNLNDVVFGMVVSGRPSEIDKVEKMVGIFINTIPIRVTTKSNQSFKDVMVNVQEGLNQSKNYEYLPLTSIQNESAVKQNLIQCLSVFENYPVEEVSDVNSDFSIGSVEGREQTNYDLNIFFFLQGNINYKLMYNKCVYSDKLIEKISKHLEMILTMVAENPELLVDDIELLDEKEKSIIINKFNDRSIEYPKNSTLKELFEEQIVKNKWKTAIVSNGIKINYEELNKKSNQIAHLLRKKGVTNDTIVPIICDRGIETITSMLGVIKAGGAYLPIDKEYPEIRVRYMLDDSESKFVLGKEDILSQFNLEGIERINICSEQVLNQSVENLSNINSSKDLAYVIYTSGSTGKPKGVCVEHRNVVRIVKKLDFIKFKEDDKVFETSSFAFDVSVFEIWCSLLNGSELHIESKSMLLNSDELDKYLNKNKVTICWFTSALFNQLCEENTNIFKPLRYLLIGGDVVSPKYVSKLKKIYKDLKIINGYGPSENTIFSTTYTIYEKWNEDENIPIGKPVYNSTAYIMDKNNKLLSIGIPGELCVGGDGVVRGYLNRPDLTAEKFTQNPYIKGERIYKTGDLAKWLPDGNIEFLGRIDNQVKVRGFRIELGEIESHILKHDKVKEVVVLVNNDKMDNKYLCAYIVADEEIDIGEMKKSLQNTLPKYMIPSFILQIAKMPLNINGKVDKNSLPKVSDINKKANFQHARNIIELKMSKIWSKLLGHEKIDINDSFFDIGGNSLLSIKLVNEIKNRLDVIISITEISNHTSIKSLCSYILNQKETKKLVDTNKDDNIVLMKRGGENSKILFFIPDGTGDPSSFIYTINELSDDFTCWGIVYDLLNKNSPQNIPVEDEAVSTLNKIKSIQKEGPYNIVAFCYGGYLTNEIIKILESNSEKIENVCMIEVAPPMILNKMIDELSSNGEAITFDLKTEIAFVEENLKGLNYNTNVSTIEEFWSEIISINGGISDKELNKLKENIPIRYKISKNDFDTIGLTTLIRHINAIRSSENGVLLYKESYKKYISPTTKLYFIRATDGVMFKEEAKNWEKIFVNKVEHYEVEGSHFGVMKNQGATKIANIFKKVFDDKK